MARIKGIVEAVTQIKEFQGKLNVGFRIQGQNTWFNAYGNKEQLDELLKLCIKKGNEIDFENAMGVATEFELISEAKEEQHDKDGGSDDDLINFEHLLNFAHEKAKEDKFDLNIETLMVQVDFDKKTALFKAIVSVTDQNFQEVQRFEAHGDATPDNISGGFVKPHFVRMAETRAIARALRWYTNNAKCTDVETSKGKLPEIKSQEKTEAKPAKKKEEAKK